MKTKNKETTQERKKKNLVSSLSKRKQYFVAMKFLQWASKGTFK